MKTELSPCRSLIVSAITCLLATPLASAATASRAIPRTLIIANTYEEAGGCKSTGQQFSYAIPNPEQLDVSVRGVVPGITFRETTHVGNAGYRNVGFDKNSTAVKFELFADGAGSMQGGACVLGICVPSVCVGGSGASIGIEVTAHYKQ